MSNSKKTSRTESKGFTDNNCIVMYGDVIQYVLLQMDWEWWGLGIFEMTTIHQFVNGCI